MHPAEIPVSGRPTITSTFAKGQSHFRRTKIGTVPNLFVDAR